MNIEKGVYPVGLKDPYADDETQPFWDAALEGKLVGNKCSNCGTFRLPPTPFCYECQHRETEWVELPGTGAIYSFIIVRHPLRPEMQEAVPYVSAVIEVDGTQGAGARMLANVVDCDPEKVKIGDKVKVKFDKLSDTLAIARFAPV